MEKKSEKNKPTREDYFETKGGKTIIYKKGRFVKLRDGANLLEVTPNKVVKVLSLDPEDFDKIQIVYVDKGGKMKPSTIKKTDVYSQSTIKGFENQIEKPKEEAKKESPKSKTIENLSINASETLKSLLENEGKVYNIDTTQKSRDLNKAFEELNKKGYVELLEYKNGFQKYRVRSKPLTEPKKPESKTSKTKTDAAAKKQTKQATTTKPTGRKTRKSDTKQQQKTAKPATKPKKQEEPKKPESPFIEKPFYVATTFKKDGSTEVTKGLNLKAICEHCGLNYKGTKDKLAYKLRLKASTPFEALQNKTNYYTATNKNKDVVIVERF